MLRLRSLLAVALVIGALAPAGAAAAPAVRLAVRTTGPGAVSVSPLGRTSPAGPCDTVGWCSYYYPSGTAVTVSARADSPPATFARWLGDCQQLGARAACTLTMDTKHIVLARFGPVSLRVAETVGGDASIDTPGQTTCGPNCVSFPYGTTVTTTAHQQPGFTFKGWSGWCSIAANPCSRRLDQPLTVAPLFCQEDPSGIEPCTGSMQQPLGKPVPTHIRALGGSGYLKVSGTSCSRARSCDPQITDNLNVSVLAVGARPGFYWSGRCHGRKNPCQFNVGLSPIDGSQPVVKAHFPIDGSQPVGKAYLP